MARGEIDFKILSVSCSDLTLYKKAFRVQIRALMKEDNEVALKKCMNTFYKLACFVRSMYGFHSCAIPVLPWQEVLAKKLQVDFEINDAKNYNINAWIEYTEIDDIAHFEKKYKSLFPKGSKPLPLGVQDNKVFLTLKDKSHFEKVFK